MKPAKCAESRQSRSVSSDLQTINVRGLFEMTGSIVDLPQTSLARKLEQKHKELVKVTSAHEELVHDLEQRLEQAHEQLAAFRRQDLKASADLQKQEKIIAQHEQQISDLSGQLKRQSEASRSWQHQYSEQCQESDRIRSQMRIKDIDIRNLTSEVAAKKELELVRYFYLAFLFLHLKLLTEMQRPRQPGESQPSTEG